MLERLGQHAGTKCNPHIFRRSFASILAKRGVDSLHIMRLGRWESLEMVDRYTRSVQFEDSFKPYRSPLEVEVSRGLSTLDIMHLGGWEDLSMVMRYTKTITFDDCLEHYRKLESG